MYLVLFLAVAYLFTLLLGILLEKIRIPWIFAALIFGLVLAFSGLFKGALESETFTFLARLGMYFFLFVIGFEIDLEKIMKKARFIVKVTTVIILMETIAGTLFIHFVFGTGWIIAAFVAHVFATVGEAVLLPILEEFNLIKTDLGQTILGIATIDDVVEILSVLLLPFILGGVGMSSPFNWSLAIPSLIAIFGLVWLVRKLKWRADILQTLSSGSLLLLMLFVLLLFIWIGSYAEAAAIGALFSGIVANNLIPEKQLDLVEKEVKGVTYGFFGPLFFLWVGSDVSISLPSNLPFGGLAVSPILLFVLIVLGTVLLVNLVKIGGTLLVGWKELGFRKSIFMGVALAVKFSTSIVIIKILFEQGLIGVALYSVLITSTIVFKFIIPFLLSYLVKHWNISGDS